MPAPIPMLTLTGLTFALIVGLILQPWWVERRRARLRDTPFPVAWSHILRQRLPQLRRLPRALQRELNRQIMVFVAEKDFIGCGGFVIDDEVRLTIAAQACLLTVNQPRRDYYPALQSVLVYPGPFFVDRSIPDVDGIVAEQRVVMVGESWAQGRVVLSWPDVVAGAAIDEVGRNVVIHEFAHQLDQATGSANGAPLLPSRRRYATWSNVLGAAFTRLCEDLALGRPNLIDAYAATNPAEFFAVVSEVFFELPDRLASAEPALYAELSHFYNLDPALW
jgi:Mlc titration factor MtfA (ptsG expression regulator)